MTTRILITGSRDWRDRYTIYRALNDYVTERGLWLPADQYGNTLPSGDVVVVHGGARGADTIAGDWAISSELAPEVHLADWATLGRGAGIIRNKRMVDLGADVCLAFIRARSRGASHCASLAESRGIDTRGFLG